MTNSSELDSSTGLPGSFDPNRPVRCRSDGDIYKTTADIDGENRVVDIIRPRVQGDLARVAEMYLDGVRKWASVDDHEAIQTVLDWGTTRKGPWVALAADGTDTLRERLADGPVSDGLAFTMTLDCADALAHLHEHRVHHLALTPDRIVLKDDQPLISAVGTGNALEANSGGLGALSMTYAAPEQFDRDRFGEPDERTDVYRLAVICYELVTGQTPYEASGVALIEAITDVATHPRPPSDTVENAPDGVDEVLGTALATDPSERYASVDAFAAAIADLDVDIDADSVSSEGAESGEWSQYGGTPTRTAYAPAAGPSDSPERAWAMDTGYHEVLSSPVVSTTSQDGVDSDEQTVYFGGNDDEIHAIASENGSVKWSAEMSFSISTSPAAADGAVFVTNDETLFALDAESGDERWTVTAGTIRTAPAVVDAPATDDTGKTVLFGSDDGHVYAVVAGTGEQRWAFETDGRVVATPAALAGGTSSEPVTVYVGTTEGTVYALDVETGEPRWVCDELKNVQTAPAVRYGTVYVPDYGTLRAIDADSGEVEWTLDTDSTTLTSPAVDGGMVFFGCEYAGLQAIDADTGEQAWVFAEHSSPQAPAVSDGTVYAATQDGDLYFVDANTGNEIHSFDLGEGATTAPALGPDTLYVGGEDGSLIAVRSEVDETTALSESDLPAPAQWTTASATPARTRYTGDGGPTSEVVTAWELDPSATLSVPVLAADNTVYVADSNNNLLAVDAADGRVDWRSEAAFEGDREIITDGNQVYAIGPQYPDDKRQQSYEGSELIYAVDADSGEQAWTVEGTGTLQIPAVSEETIYVLDEESLRAIAVETGDQRWRYDGSAGHTPVVGYETIYLANKGTLTAIDANQGTERWTVDIPRSLAGAPALADERLHLATQEGSILALDAATGEQRWTYASGAEFLVGVAVESETVYAVTKRGCVLEVNGGDLQWEADTGAPVKRPLAVTADCVYVATRDAVAAFDRTDGERLWQYRSASDGYTRAPAVGNGKLVLVDETGAMRGLVPRK